MERSIIEDKIAVERSLLEIKQRQVSKKNFEVILRLYSLLGLLASFLSIIYFILITIDIKLSQDQILALTIAGVGLTLSITSWTLLSLRKDMRKVEDEKIKAKQQLLEYLMKWTKFEIVANNLLSNYKENSDNYFIGEIVERLLMLGLIDKADYLTLEEGMKIRNVAIHTDEIISMDLLVQYSQRIEDIIAKMLKAKP